MPDFDTESQPEHDEHEQLDAIAGEDAEHDNQAPPPPPPPEPTAPPSWSPPAPGIVMAPRASGSAPIIQHTQAPTPIQQMPTIGRAPSVTMGAALSCAAPTLQPERAAPMQQGKNAPQVLTPARFAAAPPPSERATPINAPPPATAPGAHLEPAGNVPKQPEMAAQLDTGARPPRTLMPTNYGNPLPSRNDD